ncbi:thermonuclease family protein [Aromatoleum toluolicum]|uniref:Nuclease n=1 Tax=Aromatoleum toluolicum TaxID=90060 RepID=A0ABX1NIU0_9RHOO|nr:thermonuclease family protein [Aromatoleum toluolicum]NMF99241.1 thermonuclease family protein [Aromatoleum toluolicum]
MRLSGIDAPERSQSYGHASRRHLARMLFGKTVTIVTARTDRYGHQVGKVIVDQVDANLVQLRAGFAKRYKRYAHEQPVADRGPYAQAAADARKALRGLWHDAQPPPRAFRQARRNQAGPWVSGK